MPYVLPAVAAVVAQAIEVPVTSAAAVAYQAVSDRFWAADQLAAPALAALLLVTGAGARIHAVIARRAGERRYVVAALFAVSFAILVQCIRAPLDYFWVRAHDRATGAPVTGLAEWMPGQARELLWVIAACVVAATAVYWLMARAPRAWWIHAAVAGSGLVLFALVAQPWTQSYKPVDDSPIGREIVATGARVGVPAERIGVRQSGDPSGCGAGSVIGLGPTRLMLLDDTLLEHYPEGEIVQSVAHESKHFTRDDNVKALVMISAWLLCALGLVHFAGHWAVSRWHARFGFAHLASPASLPLVILIVMAAYLVALPFARAYQQEAIEHEADRFALDLTHDNASEAMLYVKDMKCYPLIVANPGAFYQAFRATHPSIERRIRFANAYHPWLRHGNP